MDDVTIHDLSAVYAAPTGDGPHPGVVVLHEAFGLNADIRRIARRFVDGGYAVVAPDLYSQGFRPLCIARTILDVQRHGGVGAAATVEEVRTWLADRPSVDADRIGVIGFCLGGAVALMAGATSPFAAASVNYGEVPDDASQLDDVCPVVASYGRLDTRLSDAAARLPVILSDLGVPHDVEVYDDVGHSFLNQALPDGLTRFVSSVGYDPQAAAHAWERIDAFFARHVARQDAVD